MKFKLLNYWLPLAAYCGLIFFLSSFSHPLPPSAGLLGDKLLHGLEYSLLGVLAARAFFSLNVRSSRAAIFGIAFVFSALYGLSDEFHQSFVPGRNATFEDFAADTVGSFLGVGLYCKCVSKKDMKGG